MHRTKVRVTEDALDANETIARANRDDFDRAAVSVLNLMSAPGSGKTTLLERALAGPRRPPRRACSRATSRAASTPTASPASTSRDPAQHRLRLRRRVPPGREHGPLGDPRAAASTNRPADRRERRQPGLPGRVPHRRGREGDGRLGRRGRGQAAQVPADVPQLRDGRGQQDRPPPPRRLRHGPLPREPRRRQPRAPSTCWSAPARARASTSGARGWRAIPERAAAPA